MEINLEYGVFKKGNGDITEDEANVFIDKFIQLVEENGYVCGGGYKLIEEGLEDPYCPVCESCGEEGCCSPLMCSQSKDGYYCKGYLKDLKFGYLMYKDIYDFVPKDKIDEIFDKNWEKIYEQPI